MKKKIFLAITALTLFVVQACKMDGLDKRQEKDFTSIQKEFALELRTQISKR